MTCSDGIDREYFYIAEAEAPLVVTNNDLLGKVEELVRISLVCGIDAEWPPGASGPSATVLQLALWSPEHGLRAVILDFLELDPEAVAALLRRLFRRKGILKLGYNFRSDISAIATALGPNGASTISVIEPIIDIGFVHRRLLHVRVFGPHAPPGDGLSRVVDAHLGSALDKSQQCSAWGERPLTPEQLRYAATDACCLVFLLQKFAESSHNQLAVKNGSKREISPSSRAKATGEFFGGEAEGASTAAAEGELEATTAPSFFDWKGGKESIAAAAERWGERWESSGKGAKLIRTGGLSHLASIQLSSRKGKGAGALPEFLTFPAHIPWASASDNSIKITSEPLFITDVMLGGLARQLRLWGFDVEAVDCVPKLQRHAIHRVLCERAADERRVVLTRDTIFMRRGLSDQAYFVKSETKREQVEEVVAAFGLPVHREMMLSRCSRCNGEFGETAVAGRDLPEGHGIPEGVLESVREFWVCTRCSTAYWQGNMYNRAMENLGAAMEQMALSGKKGQRG